MNTDRNILEVYKKYKIMSNLQLHMLRVAAVAKIIADNLDDFIKIDKEKLITGALFHDMGNIIKFRLNYFPESLEPEGLEFWQNVKNEYLEKYGKDEHVATTKIMQELNIREDIVEMVGSMIFGFLCLHSGPETPVELKILHYADMRVGPYGVLSYEDRMADVMRRYADVPHDEFNKIGEQTRDQLLACGKEIEKWIFENSKIRPEDITEELAQKHIETLRDFVVK